MSAAKIPAWFWDVTDAAFRADVDGRTWVTNGHTMIAFPEGFEVPPWVCEASAPIAQGMRDAACASLPETIGRPVVYLVSGRDAAFAANYAIEMNGACYALAYVALAETLHPGCVWHVPPGDKARSERAAAYAVSGGRVVMVIAAGAKTPAEARGLAKDGSAS